MKSFLFSTVFCVLFSAPVFAQGTHTFHNPCERGPWPKVSIINESRSEFIAFLQQVRPQIPYQSAATIAFQLCEDMSLVSDSSGLTARLNYLLERHGY
jgi:fumarate hydratase class II